MHGAQCAKGTDAFPISHRHVWLSNHRRVATRGVRPAARRATRGKIRIALKNILHPPLQSNLIGKDPGFSSPRRRVSALRLADPNSHSKQSGPRLELQSRRFLNYTKLIAAIKTFVKFVRFTPLFCYGLLMHFSPFSMNCPFNFLRRIHFSKIRYWLICRIKVGNGVGKCFPSNRCFSKAVVCVCVFCVYSGKFLMYNLWLCHCDTHNFDFRNWISHAVIETFKSSL